MHSLTKAAEFGKNIYPQEAARVLLGKARSLLREWLNNLNKLTTIEYPGLEGFPVNALPYSQVQLLAGVAENVANRIHNVCTAPVPEVLHSDYPLLYVPRTDP